MYVFAVLLPATGLAADQPVSDASVHGTEFQRFDILREGSHIGTHSISRSREGNRLVVVSRTRISVRLLGFELYRFDYDARETWDEQGLLQLVASVDNDGQQASLEGRRTGERFVWSDGQTSRSHAMPVYPTNHWHTGVLGQEAVLNTLTGMINSVTVLAEGQETLELADSRMPATRYRYDGELQLLSWYDPDGRWLAMRFTTDDGATIDYRCSNCSSQANL